MKIFVNLIALVVVSMPQANAAESTFPNNLESLSMVQKVPLLKIERSDETGAANFSEVTATGCSQTASDVFKNNKLFVWAQENKNVSKFFTCSESQNLNLIRFNSKACEEAINCRKNIAQTQINAAGSDKLMNEIIAKDYAKNLLAHQSEDMDRIEILKQFAQKKYGDQIGSKCESRFQPTKRKGVCNLSMLDEVFQDQQNKCQFGSGCFNKTENNILNFENYKKKEKVAKTSFITEYNDYRIGEKVKNGLEADAQNVKELAELVTSDAFKNATPDQKADMFLNKLDSGSGDRYKDPVLAYDFSLVSEKDKLKKMLKFRQLSSIYENKDLTKESFAENFDNYRKKRAELILNDGQSCNDAPDIKKVCEDMTSLSVGKILQKNELGVENMTSRSLKGDKDFDRFKSYMGKDFTPADFDTLANAKRCLSFGLASESYSQTIAMGSKTGFAGLGDMVGSMAGIQSSVDVSEPSSGSRFIGDSGFNKIETTKTLDPKMAGTEAESTSGLTDSMGQTPVSSNFANTFAQPFTPTAYGINDDEKKAETDKKEETPAAQVAAAPMNTDNDKLNDLTKRLAAAEDKVEKMKTANEEADAAREKQKKIDEENALIKELKGQISDLKAAKEKKEEKVVVASSPVAEQAKNQAGNVYASSYNSGAANAPSRQDIVTNVDNYDSSRNSGGGSSNAISSGNNRSGNSAMLTSSGNGDNNKTLPSGVVITTVDGMTSEKASQTISNRILELNGTPFYIEEGGMVKEIIAVVKDGKVLLDEKGNPIYEKIVKGKVGDKKFAKIKDAKGRAPAAITDAADLKRDQEEKLKRERAEYLKLKNLTNGIIKKN